MCHNLQRIPPPKFHPRSSPAGWPTLSRYGRNAPLDPDAYAPYNQNPKPQQTHLSSPQLASWLAEPFNKTHKVAKVYIWCTGSFDILAVVSLTWV